MRPMKLGAVAIGVLVFAAQAAQAVGGSDEDPSNQINKATHGCQQAIVKGASKFRKTVEKDFAKCLLAAMKCDQKATDADADACRAKLVAVGSGFCATGRVDNNTLLFGVGSTAGAISNVAAQSATKAEKALAKWGDTVQAKCFDTPGVDLSTAGTGLGYTGSPVSATALVDALNKKNGGVACAAFASGVSLVPSAVEMLQGLRSIADGLGAGYELTLSYDYISIVDLYGVDCNFSTI